MIRLLLLVLFAAGLAYAGSGEEARSSINVTELLAAGVLGVILFVLAGVRSDVKDIKKNNTAVHVEIFERLNKAEISAAEHRGACDATQKMKGC